MKEKAINHRYTYIRSRSADAMHIESNTSSRFRNQSAALQSIINVLNGIPTHGQEKATG